MTLTQESNTYPAAADSERHYTHHLPSQLEQGQRHSYSISFIWCYAACKGYSENIHTSQNSIYDTFFLPSSFHLWWKIFHLWWKTEGCHTTTCFFSLARGRREIHCSHSSRPIANIILVFHLAFSLDLQPSSPPPHVLNSQQMVSFTWKTPQSLSIQAFLHVEKRGTEICWIEGERKDGRVLLCHWTRLGQRGAVGLRKTVTFMGRENRESWMRTVDTMRRSLTLMAQTHTGNHSTLQISVDWF